MLHRVLAFLACSLWGHCHIVCLGDSNTGWIVPGTPALWCEMLGARLQGTGWEVANRGQSGMIAGAVPASDGRQVISPHTGEPRYAGFHLERVLARDQPDVLLIALGTNDIVGKRPAWKVRDDILALKTRA